VGKVGSGSIRALCEHQIEVTARRINPDDLHGYRFTNGDARPTFFF
jgi:hypothetical protein